MNNLLSSGNFLLNIAIILIISSLAIFLLTFFVFLIEITQLSHKNVKLFEIVAVFVLHGFEKKSCLKSTV